MASRCDPGDLRRLTNSRSAKPKAAHHTARKPVVILRHARKAGAGEGNRTLVVSLGSCCSTIELHPRTMSDFTPYRPCNPTRRLPRQGSISQYGLAAPT